MGLSIERTASRALPSWALATDARPAWRRCAGQGILALTLALIIVTILSFGGRWAWLLDLLTFWRPHLLVLALLLAGLAWLGSRRLGVGLALAAATVNLGAMLVPAGHAALPSTAEVRVKVVTLNVLGDNRPGHSLIDFLRQSDADVIALQEVSPHWDRQLAALAEIYPYRVPATGFRPNQTVLLSRFPILAATVLDPPAAEFNTAWDRPLRAEIDVHGRSLVVYAVHPPTPRSLAQWTTRNAQLAWVAGLAGERDGSRPRIMLGDFNTPPWSFLFRDVNATAALRDAGGTLRQATRQPMLLAPHLAWLGAPVDHVLVSPDIGVSSFAVGPYVHSDHLPVIADLLLPSPGSSPLP